MGGERKTVMSINLSSLNMFRSAVDWTDNGIANLDRRYAVLNDHEYGGRLSAIGRLNDGTRRQTCPYAEMIHEPQSKSKRGFPS